MDRELEARFRRERREARKHANLRDAFDAEYNNPNTDSLLILASKRGYILPQVAGSKVTYLKPISRSSNERDPDQPPPSAA